MNLKLFEPKPFIDPGTYDDCYTTNRVANGLVSCLGSGPEIDRNAAYFDLSGCLHALFFALKKVDCRLPNRMRLNCIPQVSSVKGINMILIAYNS